MSDTATSVDDLSQSNFSIGQVLSKTFSAYFSNFLSFTFIGCVTYAPLFLLIPFITDATPNGQMAQGLISLFFYFFVSPLATATIVYAAFQHLRGGTINLGASVARGLNRVFPLIALSLLWVLGIWLGFMLLLIPGLILLIMWYVIVPCCVVERTGPLRSFGRSRELTKGIRWKLFGLLLVVFIFFMVFSVGSNALWGVYNNISDIGQLGQQEQILRIQQLHSSWPYIIYGIIVAGISLAFHSVLVVVTYYHLRQYKEGVDIETIASVFD